MKTSNMISIIIEYYHDAICNSETMEYLDNTSDAEYYYAQAEGYAKLLKEFQINHWRIEQERYIALNDAINSIIAMKRDTLSDEDMQDLEGRIRYNNDRANWCAAQF